MIGRPGSLNDPDHTVPFPKLTIAVKLYAIFALVATVAVAIAGVAQQLRNGALDADAHNMTWLLGVLSIALLIVAASGAAVVWRSCAALAAITRVTDLLAEGHTRHRRAP